MSSDGQNLAVASQTIMDIISRQNDMTKITALLELLKLDNMEITVAGKKVIVNKLELTTEYPNVNYTKLMTKNETWRASVKEVFGLQENEQEQLIANMDTQFMLKMTSHKRKRAQEIVNALKNEIAGSEVIPEKTKTKRFFGMR